MSYLHRLVEQSGLRSAGGTVGAVRPLSLHGPGRAGSGHLDGADGGEEIEAVVETAPAPLTSTRHTADPPARDAAPAAARPARRRLTTAGPTPDQALPAPDAGGLPIRGRPELSHNAGPHGPRRGSPTDAPAAKPGTISEEREVAVNRHERLLRVVEWLAVGQPPAEPASPATRAMAEPAGPHPARPAEPAPSRLPGTPGEASMRRERTVPPPAAEAAAPAEVWIDTVNLTLEAPPPAAPAPVVVTVPPPPAPRHPAGPPARTTTTDRLRRRYLRV